MDSQQYSQAHRRPSVPSISVSSSASDATRSRRQQPSPSRDQSPLRNSRGTTELTPPLTPQFKHAAAPSLDTGSHTEFHDYLRAVYHFHPTSTVSSLAEESSITVPINQGDIILVHSIQPNGWADGTLLASGARGWLPTNYCEAYDHDAIRNLLNALTLVWEFLRGNEDGDVTVYARQDYVRGMIAGVRCFLERSNCLNRDSPLVQSHVGIRRMRKGLLGDLSAFVKAAKLLQEMCHQTIAPDDLYDLLDDIILKGFKVVTRAVHFLDVWTQDVVLKSHVMPSPGELQPLTPPVEHFHASTTNVATEAPSSQPSDLSSSMPPTPHSDAQTSPADSFPLTSPFTPISTDHHAETMAALSQASPASVESPASKSDYRPRSLLFKRASAAHRISYSGLPNNERTTVLASERLKSAYDAFLGFAGTFVGGLPQSRTAVELRSTTDQAANACNSFLAVVEEIYEHDYRRSQALVDARNAMDIKLRELGQAVNAIFAASESRGEADVFIPDPSNRLADTAIACVRAAGVCSTLAASVITRIGDFDYDPIGLGISTDETNANSAQISHVVQEDIKADEKPLPPPPEPSARPPPPPPVITTAAAEEADAQLALVIPPPRVSSETIVRDVPGAVAHSQASVGSTLPTLDVVIPRGSPIQLSPDSPAEFQSEFEPRKPRIDSNNVSLADSFSTGPTSLRRSESSAVSQASTRPSTPDGSPSRDNGFNPLMGSFTSLSECQSTIAEESEDGELQFLAETHAHELVYNKEGNIIGGSLPALVEMLTTRDSTPDVMFVNTFYLTFRLFTTPKQFAQALVDRYDFVGDNHQFARPVRLRVYNVFKGWLESHWRYETDSEALVTILQFADDRLRVALPSASKRLIELAGKVSTPIDGHLVPRLTSSIGRGTNAAVMAPDTPTPSPIISKGQLNQLKNSKNGGQCSILDFDPLELARQFTLIESKIFCSIQADELLALEWTKKIDSKAVNVRAMSTLSTDLTNLVADTILHFEDPKKRAVVIKQWVKIAKKCLELNNYDSLMAIICSLNSSVVLRLKKTWDLVSPKTLARLQELKKIVDISKNHAMLRQRLQTQIAPCLPFVGIYLTDLTFVDVGNPATRQLQNDGTRKPVSVINFDKYARTAKIIGDLQRFQIPYRLQPIPEMQDWMEAQIRRVRSTDENNVHNYYRRSLLLEPREQQQLQRSPTESSGGSFGGPGGGPGSGPAAGSSTGASTSGAQGAKEKFDFWTARHFPAAMMSKEKVSS